jgi:hypothetical protein
VRAIRFLKESNMSTVKPLRLVAAAAALSLSAVAALAQSTPSAPPAEKPPMANPDAAPGAQNKPAASTEVPKAPKSTAAPAQLKVGANAFSSDGSKVGDVRAVKTAPDGRITAIQVKVGGFLGFGGRIVEIPEGKFTQRGDTVHLGYTSDELGKLPEVKDAS